MSHYVYALCDRDGDPVYIGVTSDIDRRVREHKGKKFCSVHFSEFESRAEALSVESELIVELNPVYNVEHNISKREMMINAWDLYRDTGNKSQIAKMIYAHH